MSVMLKVRDVEIGAGIPKIIVPITGETEEDILESAKEIKGLPADVVEWRADFYEDLFNTRRLLKTLKALREILGETPIIFTIRTKPEGGNVDPKFEDYSRINMAVAESGDADFVDVEMFWGRKTWDESTANASYFLVKDIRKIGCLVIGSRTATFVPSRENIPYTLEQEELHEADILRVEITPDSKSDVLGLLEASTEYAKEAQKPFIAVAAGNLGIITRTACEFSGSCMTFGAAGKITNEGDLHVSDLKDILTKLHYANTGA